MSHIICFKRERTSNICRILFCCRENALNLTGNCPGLAVRSSNVWYRICVWGMVNTLRPRQNGCHFPDKIFKCIFLNKMCWRYHSLPLRQQFYKRTRWCYKHITWIQESNVSGHHLSHVSGVMTCSNKHRASVPWLDTVVYFFSNCISDIPEDLSIRVKYIAFQRSAKSQRQRCNACECMCSEGPAKAVWQHKCPVWLWY